VVDNQDGTYNLMYSLSSEGNHTLHPKVNGTPLRQHGFPVMAAFGPLQAQDVIASLQNPDEGHVCGGICKVLVKVDCVPIAPWCRMYHYKSSESVESVSTLSHSSPSVLGFQYNVVNTIMKNVGQRPVVLKVPT